jgi:hypothetical protein
MSSSVGVEIGNIYKIAANEENGITPPIGRNVWYKHFVVMGETEDGSLFGCVVFDSEMNRGCVPPGDEIFYIPIPAGRYSFIDHDSVLECLKLKPADAKKLLSGKAEGKLNQDDFEQALKLVKMSRRNDFMTLKMFGLK